MAQQRYEKDSLRLSKEAERWEKTLKHYRGLQAKGVVLDGAQKHKLKSALAALKRVAKEQSSLDKKRTDRIKELKDQDKNYDTDLASLEKSLASLPSLRASQGNHTIAAQRLALKGKIAQLKKDRKELQGYTDAPTIEEKNIQDRFSSKEGMSFSDTLKIQPDLSNNKKNEGGDKYDLSNEGGDKYDLSSDFNRNLNLTDQEGTANAKNKLKSIKTAVQEAVVKKAQDDATTPTESKVKQKNKNDIQKLPENTPVTYLPDLDDLNRQTGLNIKSDKEWQSLVKSNQVFDTTSMGSKGGYFVNDINDVPRLIKAIKSGRSYA